MIHPEFLINNPAIYRRETDKLTLYEVLTPYTVPYSVLGLKPR